MTATQTDVITELKAWLEENWDPDIAVGEWWERLGLAGWSAPMLPENAYGRGLSRADTVRVQQTITEFGALGAPGGLGLLLAAPTIASHGTQEQIDKYVRDIVTGKQAWCQLFSEPGAGSDLAGLTCKAVKDGDIWVINGQKVWTSGGQIADMGMLIARTNPDAPKHQGITWFAFDMHQAGVDVRPLKEMTGRALFNEVFISDATTTDDDVIGGLNNGWAVANTTLAFERAGLGAGGGSAAAGAASPGTIAGDLDKKAGEFVGSGGGRGRRGGGGGYGAMGGQMLAELAKSTGKISDPTVRQDLARLHSMNEIAKFMNLRSRALRSAGQPDIPGGPNIAKLSMSHILRLSRDLGLRLLGPRGTLHAYTTEERDKLNEVGGNAYAGFVTEMALMAQGPPIYGGTDQIQRNIIGERVLGLPKEPNNDKVMPFKELPKNG